MLEMQIVLRAVLGSRELIAADEQPEPASRRNITNKPGRGSRAILAKRSAPAKSEPEISAAVPAAS